MSTFASVSGASGIAFDGTGGLHTNPNGGLAYVGARLYAVDRASQEIRELDASGATLSVATTSATIACPDMLATWQTDLYVTTCSGIWRIRNINASPVFEFFSNPGSSAIPTHGITISADGVVIVTAGSNIWRAGTVNTLDPQGGSVMTNFIGATGLAALSPLEFGSPTFRFLFVTKSDGTIAVFDKRGLIPTHDIVNGGSGGDGTVIGPDGCLYVTQTANVARISDASLLGCDLLNALGATPSITLTGGLSHPHINVGAAIFTAALNNAPLGAVVHFSVSGANTRSADVPSSITTNRATFTYTGTNTGTDTITASITFNGNTITSAPLTQVWYPPLDTTPPLISFTVTGTGANVLCPGATLPGDPLSVYCGWYDSPPTVNWTFSDPESGVDPAAGIGSADGCGVFTLASDSPITGTPVTCTVTNGDGLSTHKTVVLQALVTPPMISASATAGGSTYVSGTLTKDPVTVTFTCTHAIPTAIAWCTPPGTISSGDGTPQFLTGTATDLAGKTASTTFGPIRVDTMPPAIGVNATTGAQTYVFGSWVNTDVLLTFTCTDASGTPSCPAPLTLSSSSPGVMVTSMDAAGNIGTFTTGPIRIDKTPPSIVASAKTADGQPYVAGTPTNQNVIVHFTCGTDGAPITSCAPDTMLTVSGTVTGDAFDAAGNTATTDFGPILIDRVPPTIVATVTVIGVPYDGSWTRGPVLVHFTCADDNPGVVCPNDVLLASDQNAAVNGTARDAAGNTATATTAPIKIDRTPPVTTATLTGTQSGGAYLLSVTVGLAATDGGSGVAFIAYRVDGGALVVVTGPAASFVVNTAGAHTVTYHATDVAANAELDKTVTFNVVIRVRTALAITSSPFVATGSKVSAKLVTDAGAPVAGETVRFTAGGVTKTAVTSATGVAAVDLGLAPGAYTLAASYAGTSAYFPSDAAAQPFIEYAMTKFAVYTPNAKVGATVQFYGSDWTKQIADKDVRRGFNEFKGYAESVFDAYWTARSGDAVKAPSSVPQYIGVILTTNASKTKDFITGDVVGIAVIKVSSSGSGDDDRDQRDNNNDNNKNGRDGKDKNEGNNKDAKGFDGRLGERALGTVLSVQRR